VNLTIAIASINAWNRLAIAFRAERRLPTGVESPREQDVGDGGKVSIEGDL
jgi:hypothetical protein